MSGQPPARCRLEYARTQAFYLADGSEYLPGAPGRLRNSSTKKFRGTAAALAARPRDRTSSQRKTPYRPSTTRPPGNAGRVSAGSLRHLELISQAARRRSQAGKTSPVRLSGTGVGE